MVLGQSGYAGSPPECIYQALSIANLSSNSVLYDIGSGDGRVPIIASKIFKCKSIGIEYDKNLVQISKRTVERNRLTSLVKIFYGDALKTDFSNATHIYLYHQTDFLNKLKPLLEKTSATIICLDYGLPWKNDKPIKTMIVNGHEHSIYMYGLESPLVKAAKLYNNVHFYEGQRHNLLVRLAEDYSNQMASINSQSYRGVGHFGVEKRYAEIRNKLGLRGNEVTAESWSWKYNYPIDIIAKEMFDSWNYSSGHWAIVSKPHKLYGDAIAKSKQGIYYATIIVAD